jgi:hypothetical protein
MSAREVREGEEAREAREAREGAGGERRGGGRGPSATTGETPAEEEEKEEEEEEEEEETLGEVHVVDGIKTRCEVVGGGEARGPQTGGVSPAHLCQRGRQASAASPVSQVCVCE